jgi:hypothetical protein
LPADKTTIAGFNKLNLPPRQWNRFSNVDGWAIEEQWFVLIRITNDAISIHLPPQEAAVYRKSQKPKQYNNSTD